MATTARTRRHHLLPLPRQVDEHNDNVEAIMEKDGIDTETRNTIRIRVAERSGVAATARESGQAWRPRNRPVATTARLTLPSGTASRLPLLNLETRRQAWPRRQAI